MQAPAAPAVSWSYAGATGPDQWGGLASQNALCASGRNQTPVNLTNFAMVDHLAPIHFSYNVKAIGIVHRGYDVNIRFQPGGYIEVNGIKYQLLGLHFHVPSEHHVNGNSYAMEGHFVNADVEGNLAVVGVLFAAGRANATLAKIASDLPAKAGEQTTPEATVTAEDFLPTNRDYYNYSGSLTTPPCSEGVNWFVLTTPLSVSSSQTKAFMHADGGPNNRPLQPINARRILDQGH